MLSRITDLLSMVESFSANDLNEIENFRISFLGKKGYITSLFSDFKSVPPEQKKEIGQKINLLKNKVQEKIISSTKTLTLSAHKSQIEDISLPGDPVSLGSRHPLSIVKNDISEIFSRIGFTISSGPEIEDDWHVFTALNFPENHPARDMQDTFFISKDPDILLRTQTSSVQIRVMENYPPPIRTISPGRVFRNEAISARAYCIFHQVEGLYVDENVSFSDLKQTLFFFAREILGKDTKIRLRPSFFPFTEPSAEMDINCTICGGTGCTVCKYTGWVEILGCGMVDPNVLDQLGIDTNKFTGFAFGMGIERIAMLKYQINDLRIFYENDIRFLNQFSTAF